MIYTVTFKTYPTMHIEADNVSFIDGTAIFVLKGRCVALLRSFTAVVSARVHALFGVSEEESDW